MPKKKEKKEKPSSNKNDNLKFYILLALIAFAVYANSLSNDFVFDDEDVAGLKAGGFEEFVGEGIAGEDFVGERDRDQTEFGVCMWRILSPLRGWLILAG